MLSRRKMLGATAALLGVGATAYLLQQRALHNSNMTPVPRPKSTDEKIAELLAKPQLSPEEMQEFVKLQDQRMLVSQRGEFISKHTFTQSDMAARLQAIDWFANCGKPLKIDLTMPVEQVSDWTEATENCNGSQWDNTTLSAHNQLSVWLHVHAKADFQNWNLHVEQFKGLIAPISENVWEPYVHQHELDKGVLSDLRWNVLGAMMENIYLRHLHRCFFSLEIFTVYEAGHFPCGWTGDWPRGELLVY